MAVTTARAGVVTVTIDGTDHAAQIVNLTLDVESNASGEDRKTLSGESIPDAATYTDTLTGTVIQDWTKPGGGLVGHTRLPANRGKVVPFTLTVTDPANTYSATGTVQMQPLSLALDGNETPESELSWRIISITETFPAAP